MARWATKSGDLAIVTFCGPHYTPEQIGRIIYKIVTESIPNAEDDGRRPREIIRRTFLPMAYRFGTLDAALKSARSACKIQNSSNISGIVELCGEPVGVVSCTTYYMHTFFNLRGFSEEQSTMAVGPHISCLLAAQQERPAAAQRLLPRIMRLGGAILRRKTSIMPNSPLKALVLPSNSYVIELLTAGRYGNGIGEFELASEGDYRQVNGVVGPQRLYVCRDWRD